MNFSLKKNKILFALFLLFTIPFWSQNVKVELTFTYSNSILKTFTVGDLKIKDIPIGASGVWYDALTGGTIVPSISPLVNGKRYYLQTIPAAAIGSRLQTIVYEVNPYISANKPNPVCSGEQITLTANDLLATEQFTNDNTNGKGLDLTKITQFGTSTYFVKKQKMSWEDANTLITAIPGASMYMINSTAEENTVFAALQSQGLTGNDNIAFWLGLKQYGSASDYNETQANQGGWYWIDGTALGYSNWGSGEPNDYKSATQLFEVDGIHDEDYAQFEFQTKGITWNDAPNDSSNRNSYPIFEFTATSSLQWYKYNYITSNFDIMVGENKDVLKVTAVSGNQKYKLSINVNGINIEKEYEIVANKPLVFPIATSLTTTCDDEINPLNQDGKAKFDSSSFESTILGGQTGMIVKYFDSSNVALASPLPNPFVTTSQTITARVEKSTDSSCFTTLSIPFVVNALPKIKTNTGGSEDVYVCSDLYPKNIVFDAAIQDGSPTTDYTYIWYKNGLEIIGETNATYTASLEGSYSVKVTSKTSGCSSVRIIKYIKTDKPSAFAVPVSKTTSCDDEVNPLNQDGKVKFNTTGFESTILGSQTGVVVKYFDSLNAIIASPLANPFESTTQILTARVENILIPSCFNTVQIPLVVNALPRIKTNSDGSDDVQVCSNATNNTRTLTASIQDNTPTTDYTYIWSKNGTVVAGQINATYDVNSAGTYSVLVTSKATGCSSNRIIKYTLVSQPQVFALPTNLTMVCDDEQDPLLQDGQFAFDTSKFDATILGTQTGMIIKYTDQAGNALPSPLPNPFLSASQNITATVANSMSVGCDNSIVIPLIVNPLPKIKINADDSENVIICSNQPLFTDTLLAGINDGTPTSDYDFVWYKDGVVIPSETNPTLTVNQVGQYSVKVKFKTGSCFSVRNITVTHSDSPKITSIDIQDLNQNSSIKINAEGNGKYQYSISGFDGYFQDSNVFKNIEPGIYTAIVNDLNKCGSDQKTAFVIGAPHFFTPNGDGYNDFWTIKGIDAATNANAALSIYDRFGKLIKQLNPLLQGWDGTLDGYALPATDYWFTLILQNGREAKGHFSLKR